MICLQTVGRTVLNNYGHWGFATLFLDPFGPPWKRTRMVKWFFNDIARRPLKSKEYYRFCGPVFAANTVHSMTCMAIDKMTTTHLGTGLSSVDLHGKTRVYGTGEVLNRWLEESSAPGGHFGLKFRPKHNALRNEVSKFTADTCNCVNVV